MPVDARVRTVHEARVERFDDDTLEIITTLPAVLTEELCVQFTSAAGEVMTSAARVISSTPVERDGEPCFRIILSVSQTFRGGFADPLPLA